MFKEYIFIKETDEGYGWFFKIIDDDFEEISICEVYIDIAIMDIYSKRNLPVVPNLIRAMLWFKNNYNISLDKQIDYNKKYNPRWHEVEQEIKKYLLFS